MMADELGFGSRVSPSLIITAGRSKASVHAHTHPAECKDAYGESKAADSGWWVGFQR